jgi:hypothetical protein
MKTDDGPIDTYVGADSILKLKNQHHLLHVIHSGSKEFQ